MSHRAVNWALEQRQVKPGPWRVLVMLADRHNKDTLQVNPAQDRLAADCNMSRATVNRHLDELEALGLIRRIRRQDPRTKRQLPTFYILGLDFGAPPHIENAVSQIETRASEGQNENTGPARVSDCDTEPCLNSGESRVSKNADPVSQIETLTMEGNQEEEPCAGGAQQISDETGKGGKPGTLSPDVFADTLKAFIATYPRRGDLAAVEAALREAIDGGVEPARILASARAYAVEQKGNPPRFIAYPDNWLRQRRWEQHAAPSAPASDEDILANLAAMVTSGKSYAASAISPTRAHQLLDAGLVTRDQLRAVGLHA